MWKNLGVGDRHRDQAAGPFVDYYYLQIIHCPSNYFLGSSNFVGPEDHEAEPKIEYRYRQIIGNKDYHMPDTDRRDHLLGENCLNCLLIVVQIYEILIFQQEVQLQVS